MTPAEHIAKAEELAARAEVTVAAGLPYDSAGIVLLAVAHALIALAVEQGVPHQTTTPPAV